MVGLQSAHTAVMSLSVRLAVMYIYTLVSYFCSHCFYVGGVYFLEHQILIKICNPADPL